MTDDYDRAAQSSGAYSLGALSPEELADFEAALAESEELRTEVAGFTDTAALLGLAATPVIPPAAMKSDLLARIATLPQLPAEASIAPTSAASTATAATSGSEGARVVPISAARNRARGGVRGRSRLFLSLSAAAAAVVLFAGGALAGGLMNAVSDERAADQFAALNSASDVQRVTTELPDGGTAALVSSEDLGLSAVVLADADSISDDQTFQLWYVGDEGPVSAGTVQPVGDGTVYAMLDGRYSPDEQVAMTVEPKGGSERPTGTPLLLDA